METPLAQLNATALRKLLITEVKVFIDCLETTPPERLQEMRDQLITIYKILTEKEQIEMLPLVWGRNTTNKPVDSDVVPPEKGAMES